jgi:hypothetical protein
MFSITWIQVNGEAIGLKWFQENALFEFGHIQLKRNGIINKHSYMN